LAQAFLAAGAANVVATLWRVDDVKAVQMAISFYQQLMSGATPAEALAKAQRQAIGRNASGAVWAAYAVWGRVGANVE
jgi:CHAT domain-containing protein